MASDLKYDIFISHAGEEKRDFVDCVYQLLTNRGGHLCKQRAFLDEHSLKPGAPEPWEVICKAAMSCDAAVVVLSPCFVCKKHPMKELKMLLGRCTGDPKDFILLPVFLGLTVEDCGELEAWYSQSPWPSTLQQAGAYLEKVDESTRKEWASLVKSLPSDHTGSRLDQTNGFHGVLAANVVDEVIQRLVEVGKLPESLSTKHHSALPEDRRVLKLPSRHLVGRQEEILRVMTGLCGKAGAVVIHGPPGEGKTTVAVRAAMALCDKGWFPGGAFQVDLSGFKKTSKVKDFFADRLGRALRQARGLMTRPSKPLWQPTATWLQHDATVPMLLVLENAEDVLCDARATQDLRILLDDIQGLGIQLVVNSRINPELTLDGACRIRLGMLPAPDALLLLEEHISDQQWPLVTEVERNQLVEMCQRNPLSLKLTGGFINLGRCTAQEVLQRYRGLRSIVAIDDSRSQMAKTTLCSNRVHISWLLSMLCRPEQEAIAQLSLYAGSFDIVAAAMILGVPPKPQARPVGGTRSPHSDCIDVEKMLSNLQQMSIIQQLSVEEEQAPPNPAQTSCPPARREAKRSRYKMHLLVRELTAELRSVLYWQPLRWSFAWLTACLLLAIIASWVSGVMAAAGLALLAAWPSWEVWCLHRHHAARLAEKRMVWWMLQDPSGPGKRLVGLSKAGDVEGCRRIVEDEASNFVEAALLVDDVVRACDKADAHRVMEQLQQDVHAVFQAIARFLRQVPDGSIVTAQQAQEDAVQYLSLALGQEHVVTLRAKQRLAWLLFECGELGAALKIFDELITLFTKDRRHTDTIFCKGGVGHVLEGLGRLQEAKTLLMEVLQYLASKHREWPKLVNYYDSKYWEVSKKVDAQPAAEPASSREAQELLVVTYQNEQTGTAVQGDGKADGEVHAADEGPKAVEDDDEVDMAQQQQQQRQEEVDPITAEVAAGWTVDFLRNNHVSDIEFLRTQAAKMGRRFPEAMFVPPVEVTSEELQRMFRIMQNYGRFWGAIADLLKEGQITDTIFHHYPHWVARGKEYRELFEPVCIAHWYYNNKHVGDTGGNVNTVGHYADGIEGLEDELDMENGCRPVEFILLQRLEREVLAEQHMVSTVDAARRFARMLGKQKWQQCVEQESISRIYDIYSFEKVLRSCMYGCVYEVTHKVNNTKLCCKTINKLGLPPGFDFRAEERVLRRLSGNQCVIALIEAKEEANHLHLLTERYNGPDLFTMLTARKRLTEADAATSMAAVLLAVAHCHNRGVVHRDVRAETFLLSGPEEGATLKAAEFGLAVEWKPSNPPLKEVVGSLYYIAPEVLAQRYGYAADVWSAGVLMHVLLAGKYPFRGAAKPDTFQLISKGKLDLSNNPWPDVSEHAKDLLVRLLQKDPTKRITAAEALQHPWLAAAAASLAAPGVATPPDPFTSRELPGQAVAGMRATQLLRKFIGHIVHAVVSTQPAPHVEQLTEEFALIDRDKSGAISAAELIEYLQKHGVELPEPMQWMKEHDLDRDSEINLGEFVLALRQEAEGGRETLLLNAFQARCKDKGYMTKEDVTECLASTAASTGAGNNEVMEVLNLVDKDGDGRIDFMDVMAVLRAKRTEGPVGL